MIHHNQLRRRCSALTLAIFFACLGATAQTPADKTPPGIVPAIPVAAQSTPYKFDSSFKADPIKNIGLTQAGSVLATSTLRPGPDGVVVLTLDQAQEQAAAANSLLARLGALQVEAAKQHRLGVQAQYFPALSSSYVGLHFNKYPGDVLALRTGKQVPVNIINKDQNTVNLMAVQPITPLIAIYQLVKIARADENIAKAKAGMPVAEVAMKVEKTYFDLLVAQRELTSAQGDSKRIQAKWLTASNSGKPFVSAAQETEVLGAEKALLVSTGKVKELTLALNQLIGLPEGTALALVAPEPLVENVSEDEAVSKAVGNPEVIEAEQTAVKARAAVTLSKMAYGPTVAVVGGYTNQTSINLVFPRAASYIGTMASWTIFDFGKREHGVSEAKANAEAASLGVTLTKAKVASKVKGAYFELDRSRQLCQLARRMVSASHVVDASYSQNDPAVESARATMEADMFRAELEHRQAYAKLKALMGTR